MRLSIIPEDGAVIQDGEGFLGLTLVGIPANVNALQWNVDSGHIEYSNQPEEQITSLPDWAIAAQQQLSAIPKESELAAIISAHNSNVDVTLSAFPAISNEVVDGLISESVLGFDVSHYRRENDNVLIGISSGFIKGATGLSAFASFYAKAISKGVPIFSNVPVDIANYSSFKSFLEGLGMAFVESKNSLNEVVAAFTYTPNSLVLAKSLKKAETTVGVDSLIAENGFTYNGKTYDADERSRKLITERLLVAVATGDNSDVTWRLADNTTVAIPLTEFKEMANALRVYGESMFAQSWSKKDAIDATTTQAELDAI